ncbi:hypothetical protein INT47_010580 [Mucor saturninus]|uniref:DDE Tnp4 domain-containing protein n=1 Tax=Mucor saturninus TaxID=64648 RepID=A0A8H7QGM3_9FUNG|nr:hypothetical protein INT47_010580 [Mucor saturninus]
MSTFEESLNEFTTVYEESMTLINMNVAAIQWYMEQLFDGPSFLHTLLFLLTGTRSTRVRPDNNRTFSNYHYWTITHPFLADDDNPRTSFRAMYRMNLTSFERLVNDLSQHPAFDLLAHNRIPAYIQISCVIWRLANCHIGYRTSNMAFGVSNCSHINFFRRFLVAIEGVYGDLINWPMDQQRVEEIQTGFEWPHGQEEGAIRRLPKAIGALDGKNVVIECPRDHPEHWRDRKGNFAMKLTAICDNKCRSTYIRVGDSGRTHDSGALKWTEVYTQFLRQPATSFPLDGSAYALFRNVIVPYPLSEVSGNSDEAVAKRKFNTVHSSARMTIKRAFGILSARWRFIKKHVYMKKIKDICQVITAACILHNFCINIGDPDFETDEGIEMDEVEEGNVQTTRESVRTRRDDLNRWFQPRQQRGTKCNLTMY